MSQAYQKNSIWLNKKNRSWFIQGLVFLILLSIFFYLFYNVQNNLSRQNIASGFSFLLQEAGFEISETVIDYFSDDTYLRALTSGLLNTLKVAFIGNFIAVLVGLIIGMATLSRNWLLSKLANTYIELLRNIPLLLQLFFWYALFTEVFPSVRDAYQPLKGFFISNRGVMMPFPKYDPIFVVMTIALFLGGVISIFLYKWAKKVQIKTGKRKPVFIYSLGLVLGLPFIVWLIGGAPYQMSWPELEGFNFQGGLTFSPEFISLLLGLVLYTGAFNAVIIRAGIRSVGQGQWEAARSLGLKDSQTMRLVILPQALRVIIPPLTSQLLNLTKNSSLAVAIAYPDFVAVANTTLNQTGQAIELVSLIMLVYLIISLSTSFFMNWYNKKMALVER